MALAFPSIDFKFSYCSDKYRGFSGRNLYGQSQPDLYSISIEFYVGVLARNTVVCTKSEIFPSYQLVSDFVAKFYCNVFRLVRTRQARQRQLPINRIIKRGLQVGDVGDFDVSENANSGALISTYRSCVSDHGCIDI